MTKQCPKCLMSVFGSTAIYCSQCATKLEEAPDKKEAEESISLKFKSWLVDGRGDRIPNTNTRFFESWAGYDEEGSNTPRQEWFDAFGIDLKLDISGFTQETIADIKFICCSCYQIGTGEPETQKEADEDWVCSECGESNFIPFDEEGQKKTAVHWKEDLDL